MAESNTIQFRIVQTKDSKGNVIGERWQVNTKDTVVSILGVSLGVWSGWQEINTVVVTEQG